VDVIGDVRTTGPWISGLVDTSRSAVTRKASASQNYPADESYISANGFKWNISDWEQAIPPEDIPSSDFTFLTYHYSDDYTCPRNEDCPEGGFCNNGQKCKTCDQCLSEADALTSCIAYCRDYVSGCTTAVPKTSECLQCSAMKTFPEFSSVPILDASR
jgi:hypothetical protein